MSEAIDYQALRARFDDSPYARLLGMRLVELAHGYAKVELEVSSQFANFAGLPHGGVLMSLADHAFGCALNTLGRTYVAVQFNMHLLGAPTPGSLIQAEARVVHAGRTMGMAEMAVRYPDGRLLASATGTVVALQRSPRQPGA
ncbi:MAG: PaaI family thioesterase [Dehalococcoidales bacterium]|nr:PaaI family thioesterase [Dehalococcoidales bacterium]